MAHFDAAALLAAVDAGQTPIGTRIFGAKRTYFIEQGCFWFFVAAVCVFSAGIIGWLLGTWALLPSPSAADFQDTSATDGWEWIALFVLFLIGFVVFAVVFGARGVGNVQGLRTWRAQVLVLAPDGFVARTGPSPHALFAVSYAGLAAISLSIRATRVGTVTELTLAYRHPTPPTPAATRLEQVVWEVDRRFGDSAPIAQAILEDHTRAMAGHPAAE